MNAQLHKRTLPQQPRRLCRQMQSLYDRQNWITTRRSTCRAVAIGVFWAWLPVPGVTFIAGLHACLFRANLPLAAATVWINNPLTFAPMTVLTYYSGCLLLGSDPLVIDSVLASNWQFSKEWLSQVLGSLWEPLFAGAFFLAISTSALAYTATNLGWRLRHFMHSRARQKKSPTQPLQLRY